MNLFAVADILSDPEKIGLGVVCIVLISILFWVIKRLFMLLKNDQKHLKEAVEGLEAVVSTLPCQATKCPVEQKNGGG